MRKRILAFALAAAMVFGDAVPALAAEMPENSGQENIILDENSEVGGVVSDLEEAPETVPGQDVQEPSETEQQPETPDAAPPADTDTEETETPEGSGGQEETKTPEDLEIEEETDEVPPVPAGNDNQLQSAETDASEYILQSGGSGILQDAEDGGIALFSAAAAENVIVNGLKNRETEIDISSYGLTAAQLKPIYSRIINNNPSLFYVAGAYRYYYNQAGTVVKVVPEYLEQYDEASSARYEAAVNEALESINGQMDDVEKALALHDYLVLSCAYENDGQGNYQNYNAYNALVDGEAVCQGYTLAYTELLQRAGISVSYATSDAMNHIWNLIELGDNWYHIDTTWDDPTPDLAGRVGHSNFLRSDEGITETGHHDWVTGIEGVTCTDDSYASGQFWNGLTTAVFFEGDACYYMSSTGQIRKRSGEGSEERVYVLENTIWPVWEGSGYWNGIFTGLSRSGSYLYCNDKDSIYRISLSDGKGELIYAYEERDGYLYGSCVRGKELRLAVSQAPNKIPVRKTVALPESPLGPENTVDTWNTIDGGTADSSAPEKGRMKLLVFAPQWAYSYLSSFYVNPLFRDNKYLDVVVLDTQGQDPEEIRKNLPSYDMSEHPDAPITYCYYKETEIDEEDYRGENGSIDYDAYYKALEEKNPILQAYKKYRALTGMEEYTADIGSSYMACFLINSRNKVVYSDSQSTSSAGSRTLVDNLVNAINEKQYLRPEISRFVTFRKDEEGKARFEWEKGAGIAEYTVYYDPDEEKVRSKDCKSYTGSFADSPDQGMTDEGFITWGITGDGDEICYFRLILKDKYGLAAGDSGIVKPQGNTAPNLNYTWNTVDGGTIGSKNTSKDKLKILAFVPMNTSYQEAFYQQRLFRGKKYVETIILDTSKQARSTIVSKRNAVEKANAVSSGSSALTYCYDTGGENVKNAFLAYCAQVGAEIEYNPKNVAYFVIDQNNQIVDYFVITPEMVPQYATNSLVLYLISQIREHEYLSSDIAAPNVRITSHKKGKIVLEWDPVSGAGGYVIYRADSPEGPFWELGRCAVDSSRHETQYTDTDIWGMDEKNPDLYYKVAAEDSYWVMGPWSDVVTNQGMPQDVDPERFKELHLLDEDGNPVTSVDIHEGELKKLYLELERYNGQKERVDDLSKVSWLEWEMVYDLENVGEDSVSFMKDEEETYAAVWYEDLARPFLGGVAGRLATGGEERHLRLNCSGKIGDDSYSFQVFVPVRVEEAEAGVTYPPIESPVRNLYTDREKLNQYVRDAMVNRIGRITFCVPMDTWTEWEEEIPWDMERDVLDFYKDREGMKSWEGDYLFHSMASLNYGPLNSMSYQGTQYEIYAIDVTYWDNDNQDQKVGERLEELIWKPAGALYPYHDATEYDIVKACMDWIRKNVSYIGTPDPRYHSAYSALFNKKATCEGYSLLLYRMLREFGISNRILIGIDTNAHGYNIVEIDGKYYYTDPTSGALLKGSLNFSHATWQEMYQRPEYTKNVTSRISETDFDPADSKIVRLYRITDQESQGERIGTYKTLAEAREAMEAGGTYRIDLLGGLTLKAADELDFPEEIDCTVNLNGRTLTVPAFAGNEEVRIRADLYGGSSGKGSMKAAAGQKLYLGDSSRSKSMTLKSVSITGTPDITIGKNVTVEADSNLAVGALTVPETSANVVLEGKITAETLKYQRTDMVAGNLTVSGQTTVKGGNTLHIKGSVTFNGVKVEHGIFYLNLIKVQSAEGETASTGTASFKGTLEKAENADYAVEITRTKMTEGSSGWGESDAFMPEDSLVTITARENVVPTGYFRIPKDPYGRELSPVREGNVLKVKGVVVEVSLKDQTGIVKSQKYISVDAAVEGIAKDFGSQKGEYAFVFLGDAVLTKNLTLPVCVEKLDLDSDVKKIRSEDGTVLETEEGTKEGQLLAALDFRGFTLSTAARVTLQEGLLLDNSVAAKVSKLNLTGTYGEEAAFRVEALSGDVTWVNALGEPVEPDEDGLRPRLISGGVEIVVPKGLVVLETGEPAGEDYGKTLRMGNVSAKGLCVEDGQWSLHKVTLTERYQVSQGAAVMQTDANLTGVTAVIDGRCEADGMFTMSNTKLRIGETGSLGAVVAVKKAYGNEAKEKCYTIENYGTLSGYSLQMQEGTLYNERLVKFHTISSMKDFVNAKEKALLICNTFNQSSKGKCRLEESSVMVVRDRAVLYNAELGGAYFYQNEGCSTALEGKITQAADLPEESTGLEFAEISVPEEEFNNLRAELKASGTTAKALAEGMFPAQEIAPQTCLFTTKASAFPTWYVSVRQADPDSLYTKVYQIGSNVRVGREWIVISARKMNGEEERLESFIRWSDAMAYLSNLSNPNMTYIVHILDDVDIEQGLTMPGKSAGLVIRGTEMRDGNGETRKNVLTYTGDLNLTTPLEFSGIVLKAKKNGADYESAVKVNGMRLTFSNEAGAVFSSVKGNASSVLVLNGDSEIEVHGEVNVGGLWSEDNGRLTGLAAVKRDSAQNLTAVNPQITVGGQTDIRNGKIEIVLKEKVTVNKVTSYSALDFTADEAAQIRAEGVRLAKMPYAKPENFKGYYFKKTGTDSMGNTQTLHSWGNMSKKDGYLVWFDDTLRAGVKLVYGPDGNKTEIPFRTFAEAVAEINSLKTKRDYTIQIKWDAAELSKASPAALTMPNKNYVASLAIEMTGLAEGSMAELYYLNGLSLTSDTVLKNIAFKQMIKSGKTYVPADEQGAGYPSPVSLKTGGFALTIEGNVTFNTPLNLEGGNSGSLGIKPGASLATVTNGLEMPDAGASVIAGSVKKFKSFDVPAGQEIRLVPYGTVTKKEIGYSTAELNVTGMTICGNVFVDGGNAVIRELVLDDGVLAASGEKAGKVTLTNVTLKGAVLSEIYADRDFTISGSLDNQMENAEFYTRQKPMSRNAVQMPYLNITGKVASAEGERITVCVLPNDCSQEEPVLLTDAPKASGQLLTAKTAGIEYFAADPENLIPEGENASGSGKGRLYSPENPDGYMLVKSGSNIYVYGSEQVCVALCRGDASDGNWSNAEIMNYYPGWAEATAALNGLNQTKDTYTLLLLKDVGAENAPLKLALPSKAAKVYVASVQDGRKKIYYQNALSLGTNTEFANVILNPVTAKGQGASLGINAGNYELILKDIQVAGNGSLKDISGKKAGTVILDAGNLRLSGGISGVKSLTVQKSAAVLGNIKVDDLILEGNNVLFTADAAVTVSNIVSRGNGQNTLTFTRTNKDISNLTVSGNIRSEGEKKLRLNMKIPAVPPLIQNIEDYVLTPELLENGAVKADLKDAKKLAVMPKASPSDFEFTLGLTSTSGYGVVVKANKGIYLLDKEAVENTAVELEISGKAERIYCLDYTQAVNEINTLSDGTAEYILHLPEICADTNLTDTNRYGNLALPGNGRAAAVTLAGADSDTYLTFYGKINMSGNLTLKNLVLNPVKSASNEDAADFDISVTGSAKSGASLTLDKVWTWADSRCWENKNLPDEAPELPGGPGHINQISGTKNVTRIRIKNSRLCLKTGVTNADALALESSRLLTCKTSAVNKLSLENGTWDAVGATTITDITGFTGADSYLAGKQDAKKHQSQFTVNGKAAVSEDEPVIVKVIAASGQTAGIEYVDSYKDTELLKAPKEAAGKFKAAWEEKQGSSQTGWVDPGNRIYYKDTANFVLCGDRQEMAVRLTGISGQSDLAETYAKSWQDAVTIINNLNDSKASYTMELLKQEILTGKNGTFGGIVFPSNNKAASLAVHGTNGADKPSIIFSGNLTAYGNVTLENLTLRAMKNLDRNEAAPFTITADGVKNASSLTLQNIDISSAGGALKDIGGKNKAAIVLDSEGLTVSGGISGTPSLTVKKNAAVKGAVKTDKLTLSGGIVFTAEGTVTVTDINNIGGQNTLAYGRTAKNVSNLTVNGKIVNEEGGNLLRLDMKLPEGKEQESYELLLENPRAGVWKAGLNDAKKLAAMPKVSTSDFVFCVNGSEAADGAMTVKAGKGLYLAGEALADRRIELETESGTVTRCLDLTQAVNEINTLSDGTQTYTLYLPGDYEDTNLTDGNPYGAISMPGNGKAKGVTLSGRKETGGAVQSDTPTLTFSGGISASGNLTLEHLILEPVKSASNRTAADFNLSVTGNAKTGGASLTLDDVCTVSDTQWDWDGHRLTTENQTEITGFINQISGTKNVTNVTIQNSRLRLKTGVANIDRLMLGDSRIITCGKSAVNRFSADGSTWDALGVTTITDVVGFAGEGSYLAGKQDIKKLQPQLTVNGRAADTVTVKVIAASKTATDIIYVDSYKDVALLKAPKEAAGRFETDGSTDLVFYKDTANYVQPGAENEMEVKITGVDSAGKDMGETYAKCWQDAVTIINNTNEPKSAYTMELLRTGEIRTGKAGTAYAGLTLPSKTSGVTVRGIRDERGDTVLVYTGTLKPSCKTAFEDLVMTEGALKKNVFTPTYQITLALGNINTAFRNAATLKNPDAGIQEAGADLVVASASASRGVLTLDGEKVYAKGNFTVPNLSVAGETVLMADRAVVLTDISREEGAGNARLVLDTKTTAITRAGQQSVTQLSVKGKIENVEVGIAPQMYNLSKKAYHRLTAYEARAMLAGEAKPDTGKKLANVSKTFADFADVKLLYSYESSWSVVGKESADGQNMEFYVYNSGLYVK